MCLRCYCVIGLLLCGITAQAAEPAPKKAGPLELIPADAPAAIAIRNVAELKERGDRFLSQAEINDTFRFSEGYRFVTMYVGIHRGLDDEGAVALMAIGPPDKEDALVLAVPIKDVAEMAGNFKLKEADLAEGKIVDRQEHQEANVWPYIRFVMRHQRHLYVGASRETLQKVIKAKPLAETLSADDLATLAQDDILFYGNRTEAGELWMSFVGNLQKRLKDLEGDGSDPLHGIGAAAEELQSVLLGIRLDEGLGSTLLMQFHGEKSREILTHLSHGQNGAALAGLPQGRVLATHAASGDGDASAALLRSLLLIEHPLAEQPFVSAAHRTHIASLLGEVWQRLEGSRTALYENPNPQRDGAFSFVAILDTQDAEQFVADITSLAPFASAATLTGDEAAQAIEDKTVGELIKQLGHDEYRVRQLATTKLGLIGTPALPALEKAAESTDPEVRFRAKALLEQIGAQLAGEREEFLQGDVLDKIKPTFAYVAKAETRVGLAIDMIHMRLRAEEAQYAPGLGRLLGPDWNKLRLAAVEDQVVVLVGSNTALLEEAIGNLQAGKPGLAADERFARFQARTPAKTTAEFHVRLARLLEVAGGAAGDEKEPTETPTSLGVTIAPRRLRLDLFTPVEDVKVMAKPWRF